VNRGQLGERTSIGDEDACRRWVTIHPRAYLRDTLGKILAGERSVAALLPETYAASHAERAPAVAA
jgi:hypothetical protein